MAMDWDEAERLSCQETVSPMILHVPERKAPDPSDKIAMLIHKAETVLKLVSNFPERDRERAWANFIELRGIAKDLIDQLGSLDKDKKRLRAKLSKRADDLVGCTENSPEEVELRVLSDVIEAMDATWLTPRDMMEKEA